MIYRMSGTMDTELKPGNDFAMYYVGGYTITIPVARTLIQTLQIDDEGVEDHRMSWPINNWLVENGISHFLAGSSKWVLRAGNIPCVFFFTQFHQCNLEEKVKLTERDEDRGVKEWLKGRGATNMQWVSFRDRYGFTATGTKPIRVDPRLWKLKQRKATWGEIRGRIMKGVSDGFLKRSDAEMYLNEIQEQFGDEMAAPK